MRCLPRHAAACCPPGRGMLWQLRGGSPDAFRLHVKAADINCGQQGDLYVDVAHNCSVGGLKEAIAAQCNVSATQQRLLFMGRELLDESSLLRNHRCVPAPVRAPRPCLGPDDTQALTPSPASPPPTASGGPAPELLPRASLGAPPRDRELLSNHSTIHMTLRPALNRSSHAAAPLDEPFGAGSPGRPVAGLPEGMDPAGVPQLMENILQTFQMCVDPPAGAARTLALSCFSRVARRRTRLRADAGRRCDRRLSGAGQRGPRGGSGLPNLTGAGAGQLVGMVSPCPAPCSPSPLCALPDRALPNSVFVWDGVFESARAQT